MTDEIFIYCEDKDGQSSVVGFKDYYASQRTAFVMEAGVHRIGNGAFMRCSATAFILPDGLKEIGASAFYMCENLKMVFIPKSVERIDNEAFCGCKKLSIFCEGEPQAGWLDEEPTYTTEYVTTPEDYAIDFHRGGVSTTEVRVKHNHNWNPDKRPVTTGVRREDFIKVLNEENG